MSPLQKPSHPSVLPNFNNNELKKPRFNAMTLFAFRVVQIFPFSNNFYRMMTSHRPLLIVLRTLIKILLMIKIAYKTITQLKVKIDGALCFQASGTLNSNFLK